MRNKVLAIDDDKGPLMKLYTDELEREGFDVDRCLHVDQIDGALSSNCYKLIILDIMMSPGARYKNRDTQMGLATGFHVYKDIRAKSAYVTTPIIVLTNNRNQEIIQDFPDTDRFIEIKRKPDTYPETLATLAHRMIKATDGSNQDEL